MTRIILKNCCNISRFSNPQFHGIITATSSMRKSPFQRIAGECTYRLVKCSNLIRTKLCKLIAIDYCCGVICTIGRRHIFYRSAEFYLVIACRCFPRNGIVRIRHNTVPASDSRRLKASVLYGCRILRFPNCI